MKIFLTIVLLILICLVVQTAIAAPPNSTRNYYLSNDAFPGDQALSACASGYHMASIFEIAYTSDLKYNTSLGFTFSDAGSGPPTSAAGWIRTGNVAHNDTGFVGFDNCLSWSTNQGNGTIVGLNPSFHFLDGGTSPWVPSIAACSSNAPVWCVQN